MRMKSAMAAVLGVALAVAGPVSTHADAQGIFQRFTAREVTIPAGTPLPIVVDTGVASNTSRVEQPVRAHLSRDVRIDDQIVLPAGSELYGNVSAVRRPGKVSGRSYIALRFTTLVPRGSDERYSIDTGRISRTGRATKKKDALKIGVPAAGGAAVGALMGGKKGALIGGGVGGGAGTAVVLSTRGEEVGIGRGAPYTLRLAEPVRVRVGR
jgi:Bacterial conjugation TrbI-like protein